VPIAVRDDYVAFGLGSVEVTIPPRNYNVFIFYLWRLDEQVAHATLTMAPEGGVFVRVGGIMGGEYELHGDVLIVRLYKDGLTYKHVLLASAVVIVVVATIIGIDDGYMGDTEAAQIHMTRPEPPHSDSTAANS
jgi:hypothetical protein